LKTRSSRRENAEAPMCRLLEIAPRSACSPSAARNPTAFGASPRAV